MAKKKTKKQSAIKSAQKLDIRLLIAVAVAVGIAGGFMVFKSFAATYKYMRPWEPITCPSSYPNHQDVGTYSVTCMRYVYHNDGTVTTARYKPINYTCDSYHGYKKTLSSNNSVTCRKLL